MAKRALAEEHTALHHIQELRRRLSVCAGVMMIGAGLAYIVRGQIIAFLQRPLGQELFYTSPTGSFEFVMQVCLLVGLLFALPVLSYNLVRFIEPAFARRFGAKVVLGVVVGSFSLAVAGAAFAYYVSLPAAFRFFNAVGTHSLHPLITIDQYFGFLVGYLATFAIIFQLPLVLLFINNITPLGPKGLSKWRKHIVIAAFAIAIIMPSSPDPLSQVILALPIVVLYEISIWAIRLANYRRSRTTRRTEKAAAKLNRTKAAPVERTPPPRARRPAAPVPAPVVPRPQQAPQPVYYSADDVIDLRAAAAMRPARPVVPQYNILDLRANG